MKSLIVHLCALACIGSFATHVDAQTNTNALAAEAIAKAMTSVEMALHRAVADQN